LKLSKPSKIAKARGVTGQFRVLTGQGDAVKIRAVLRLM